MRLRFLFATLLVSLTAQAQERNGPLMLTPGNVALTLDEYNRLSELAANPTKKPEPPLDYSLKHAEIKLHASQNFVSGTVQFEGAVLRKGFVKVPLTNGVTIFDARSEAKSIPLELEQGMVSAVLSGPSDFSAALDAGLPLTIEAGRAFLKLPVPAAGSATLTLVVPGEYTTLKLSSGLVTSRTSQTGFTTIQAALVPGQTTSIWWTTMETGPAPAATRETRFLADVKSVISVGDADLTASVLADITIVQGEASEFAVQIPSGYEVSGAIGAALDSTEQRPGLLILKLAGNSQNHYEFLISITRSLSEMKADAPFLHFQAAQRETGEVLIEGTGSMEITTTEGGVVKRMDVKEASPNLRSLARYPVQAAFRYHRQANENPTLALQWVRFPDTSVLAAVAQKAEVTTLVTAEGKSLTEVKLTVEDQAQPFLKLALPKDASILSADVAGVKVKPAEATDGDRIPLFRPGLHTADPYTVSFVFLHAGAPFAKKGGSELSLPNMDIPINLLQWEIFLPEQYKVKDFGGDVISADRVPPAFSEGEALPVAASQPTPGNYRVEPLLQGQLGGIVTDPSGAVIPNARVSVTSNVSGFKMDATANNAGFWRVWNVPSGSVRIRVDVPGFQSLVEDYNYDANRPQAIVSALRVGAATETVEVMASPVNLEEMEREAQKQAQAAQNAPSANVINLQRRVAGILPVSVDVPHAGTAFHFVRPLVVDEETKVTFSYKSK